MTFYDVLVVGWITFGVGQWIFVYGFGCYYLYKYLKKKGVKNN